MKTKRLKLQDVTATFITEKEKIEIRDGKCIISLPKTRIHTLQQLLDYCQVDQTKWMVKSFIVNKWEVGAKWRDQNLKFDEGVMTGHATRKNKFLVEPLFQVKATLVEKKFDDFNAACADNAKLRSQVEKLKLKVSSERGIATRLARNHAGYDDLLADIKEFNSQLGDIQLPKLIFRRPKSLITPAVGDGHSEDAVLLFSDTHFGDRIRKEDTSGFPEYDLTIGGNRIGYVTQQAKQVLTLHRAMYPIDTLYVWIGGDMGNGELHDAPKSNQLFLPAQVIFSYDMLKFAIEDLRTLTKKDSKGRSVVGKIVLLFTVGNHMRMDEKMPTKLQAQRTLDWLIYQMLIDKFTGVPEIEIRTEMSPYIFEIIRGHRYLFAHGMQVGYNNKPDAQCKSMSQFIDRVRALFDSPEWRRNHNLMGETFSRAVIGDIHVPVSFPRLISNGSLNGQNELGVNWNMEPIPAGQQLFGVSDKHTQTWGYFLDCTAIQKSPKDMNDYGRFAEAFAKKVGR